MGKEENFIPINLFMKANLWKESNKNSANLSFLMDQYMKENLWMIKSKVMENM